MSLAQEQPIYKPAFRIISAITQSKPALVTTTFAAGYPDGQKVRIFLPKVQQTQVVGGITIQGFGMEQINNMQGVITNTNDPTVFAIDIDSSNFDAFVIPPNQDIPNTQVQYAQVIPVGGYAINTAYIDVLPY